jgi:hypothetical protein
MSRASGLAGFSTSISPPSNLSVGVITATSLTVGGVTVTNNLIIPLGTEPIPTLAFLSDPNTGIYSPGADQLAVATNGTGRLFVDASGNVCLKKEHALPDYSKALTVAATDAAIALRANSTGTYTDQGIFFVVDGANYSHIYNDGIGQLIFRTGSSLTERLRITSAGLMGLGTSAPGGLLELSSDASGTLAGEVLLQRIRSNTANTTFVDVKSRRHTAGSDWTGLGFRLQHQVDGTLMGFLEFNSLVSGQDVAIGTGGSTRLLVNSSGNVGIGTTSPTATLHVVSADNATTSLLSGATNAIRVTGNNTGIGGGTIEGVNAAASAFAPLFVGGSELRFGISGTERARIDTSGRLLVGTSSALAAVTGVTPALQVQGTGENAYASIARWSANSANPGLIFNKSRGASVGTRGVVAANDRMGEVAFGGDDGTSFIIGASIVCDVDGTPGANDMPGRLVFSTTADGAATPTEAMRINNAGELLVGYTADNGAYKLQVNSQIFATSATIATSDGRYKENVATLDGCVDLVKALRPVSFDWKEQQNITRIDDDGNEVLVREGHNFPDGTQVGFIAQEVEEVLTDKPWLGSVIKQNVRPAVTDNDGNELAPEEEFLGIAEGNLVAVLTSALQEAIGEIESLKARLTAAGI